MTRVRPKAIIAVFGGTDHKAVGLAREFGTIIASRGQILLTGGMVPGSKRVSESAIAGVGASPWIGVARAENRIDAFESGGGFVISTDLDHKRNYLEAYLCDAAVGLRGDEGTRSEVTFALSLHRPVAFVGDHWRPDWDLGRNRDGVLESLLDDAFTRVGSSTGRPKLDELLDERVVKRGLQHLPAYEYFSGHRPSDVIDWILQALSSSPNLAGRFPDIDGYDRVAAEYEAWIARVSI
jgi:hypothetical protein